MKATRSHQYLTERANITILSGQSENQTKTYLENTLKQKWDKAARNKLEWYRQQALENQFRKWLKQNRKALNADNKYPRSTLERENLKLDFEREHFEYRMDKDEDLIDFLNTIFAKDSKYGQGRVVLAFEGGSQGLKKLEEQIFKSIDPGQVVSKEIFWKDIEEELKHNSYLDLSMYPPESAFVNGVYREYLRLLPENVLVIGTFTPEERNTLIKDLITYERRRFIRVWHTWMHVEEPGMVEDLDSVPGPLDHFNSVVRVSPEGEVIEQKVYSHDLIQSFD